MKIAWEDIKSGDIVKLRFRGYNTRVPRSLSDKEATVVGRNRLGNLLVNSPLEDANRIRSIKQCDIWEEDTTPGQKN